MITKSKLKKLISMSTQKYIEKHEEQFGYADPEMVQRRANARMEAKRRQIEGDFNPFTNDPNCKSCGKKKAKK